MLHQQVERKFVESFDISDFGIEVLGEDGYSPVTHSNKTIEYKTFEVKLDNGKSILCADTHILMMSNGEEVFAQDSMGKEIKTDSGNSRVISVVDIGNEQNMFDLSIDSKEHTYYTNGILSHNTTTMAVDIMHDMLFISGTSILITSYKLKNCKDFIDRIKLVYENLPMWMKPPVLEYNKSTIRFESNSRVTSEVTNESTGRGVTINRLVVDELAFVSESIAEEFMGSVLPSISAAGNESRTKLQIISTANGTSGKFAQIWFGAVSGQNGFGYTEVKYDEVPHRDEKFEKDMIKALGSRDKFLQEFKNVFLSNKGTLVNSRDIEAIQTKDPIRTVGDLEIFVDSFANRKLMLAADVSEGIGQDYHAFQVFDVDTLEQVAEYHNNVMNQHSYAKSIIRFIEMAMKENCSDFYYTVENNGVGAGVIRLLEASENEYLANAQMISDPNGKKSGLATTGSTKAKSCATFKQMMEMGKLKVNSEKLKVQLKFFVKKGNTFAAESGMHDDLVMACIVMINMMEQLANYEDKVWDVVHELDDDGGEAMFDIYF